MALVDRSQLVETKEGESSVPGVVASPQASAMVQRQIEECWAAHNDPSKCVPIEWKVAQVSCRLGGHSTKIVSLCGLLGSLLRLKTATSYADGAFPCAVRWWRARGGVKFVYIGSTQSITSG